MGNKEPLSVLSKGFSLLLKFKPHKMRKIILVLLIGFMVAAGFVCYVFYKIVNNTDISISVNDTEDQYQVNASFGRGQSRKLLSYIDAQLSRSKQFRHSVMNGDMVLDDNTRIYFKTRPGKLLIRVNKNENDSASIERIKKLTEGIKLRLTEE